MDLFTLAPKVAWMLHPPTNPSDILLGAKDHEKVETETSNSWMLMF